MPNSYRIRTQVGVDKVLQVNLDQDYDTLEVLSMAIFPNDVYTRNCADFGVVCGRVFANKGLGLVNARVSIFIPIDQIDESNPIISTLYPYKSFDDFNEDGYKYNLLPYSPSHSGHVPVGTFPDRLDVLTNQSVIEVYDKYYKFTAKTNDAGDYMIFGIPIGEYDLFMQVDLSDIGEFSLTPQDLIRMGLATESQVNGTKFKFSENYSELPQIITLKKVIQIAPFYGQDGICQHYITRTDFDITSEARVELLPTSVFIGSLISTKDKKKLKRRCRVPAKQGWLCDMIAGPGQIESIRQTVLTDDQGYPVLEQYRFQNDGKLIDENGAWMVEIPMNLDYVYTDENGVRQISPDGSVGVPIRARYRFKIKWQQSPSLREENKRAYFLVPNVKEHGWPVDALADTSDPTQSPTYVTVTIPLPNYPPVDANSPPSNGPFDATIAPTDEFYYNFADSQNVQDYVILVDGVERPDMKDTIPMPLLTEPYQSFTSVVAVRYTLIDPNIPGSFVLQRLTGGEFRAQSSYAFSVSWSDYGTPDMVQEAINCEDRFYEFQYNKVYTVSQLIDRYSNRYFPQKSIQIKHVTDNKCEGQFNTFPTNDVYYRYDFLFIAINFILTIFKPIMTMIIIFLHVLATLWPIFIPILAIIYAVQWLVWKICEGLRNLGWRDQECKEPTPFADLIKNPFKNLNVPLFLYTEDGCERCRCKVSDQELDEANNALLFSLQQNLEQFDEQNISYLANLAVLGSWRVFGNPLNIGGYDPEDISGSANASGNYNEAISVLLGGNAAAEPYIRRLPIWEGNFEGLNITLFTTSLTLGEKMNLFNTKAKYFDNTTQYVDSGSALVRTDNSISPGNTGWNQAKVTWNPDFNDPSQVYHFDNLLVLLVDESGFTKGDIITFQNPTNSTDPNVNTALGIKSYPAAVTVDYANPNLNDADFPLLSTVYDMTDAYPNQNNGLVGLGPNGAIFQPTFSDNRTKSCYPMDIEYFQVIKVTTYQDYYYYTNFAPPDVNNDLRFSLPWRFLRSDKARPDKANGAWSEFAGPNLSFGNGMFVYRTIMGDPNDYDCLRNCVYNTTNICGNFDIMRSFIPDPSVEDPIPFEERPSPNLRILFLQRGVDPNAPSIDIMFDLRRYYGLGQASPWDEVPTIAQLGVDSNISIADECIVTGKFKPNVPIQPGDDNNPFGLKLPKHNEIVENTNVSAGGRIFHQSKFFRYLVRETTLPFIGTICPLPPCENDYPFSAFTTTMPNYYSALDENTLFFNYRISANGALDGIDTNGAFNVVGVNSTNIFSNIIFRYARTSNPYFLIPCGTSYRTGANMGTVCGNTPAPGIDTSGPGCSCSTSTSDEECAGCCRYRSYMFDKLQVYPSWTQASYKNEVGPYWGREYVEGGSAFFARITSYEDNGQYVSSSSQNCTYEGGGGLFSGGGQWNNGGGNCEGCGDGQDPNFTRSIYPSTNRYYISPVYATFPDNIGPTPAFLDFFAGNVDEALRTWYVNPNHTIQVNNPLLNVFRTDRLPSSDTPQSDNNGNGYMLHQNNGFSIYKVVSGCTFEQIGGGVVETPTPTVQVNYDDLPGGLDGPYYDVARSLSECQYAVDLNSYYNITDPNGNQFPAIHEEGGLGYSRQDAAVGADWVWFIRNRGCYNFVSKPLASLFPHKIDGDPDNKYYWDIASVVEWIQRLKLTFAQCFEIFSHTFSNNWINGTLYAYPFQNQTIFDAQNNPIRRYCSDTIYFHNPLNNYYYRSSPWNGSDFVGKVSTAENGNIRNLLTPTTILDMGPKASFIQELVYSDEYDGYIVDRIPSTTYQDTTDLLNLFVLSRILNTSFLQQIIPLPVDEGGNEEGSDDPTVGAMFQNTRWANGSQFALGILPGLIDADYAQMISINSEFGVQEYSPETYTNNSIFFGEDEGIPATPFIIAFRGRLVRSNKPVFGIFFSSDTQLRDYVSPRRTLYDEDASLPPADDVVTDIKVKTQVVPFYQWNIFHDRQQPPGIFGYQSNNYITEYDTLEYTNSVSFPNGFFSHGYQSLDRLNPDSEYFNPDGNNAFTYKGYIINYEITQDINGNNIYTPTATLQQTPLNRYTFGAPYHFYFGLIQGASAMDLFIQKYVDTNIVYE